MSAPAVRPGRWKILLKTRKSLRRSALAVLAGGLALSLLLAAYAARDFAPARSAHWSGEKPEAAEGNAAFERLSSRNPDVVAWLELFDTPIDYPVCRTADMARYLDHDAAGNESGAGALFVLEGSAADLGQPRAVIYGHRMDGGLMFGSLGEFRSEEYFARHEDGRLWLDGAWHPLRVVGFLSCDAYDQEVYGEQAADAEAYAKALLERAVQRRELPDWDGSRVLLLSTCAAGSANGRDVLACVVGSSAQAAADEAAASDGGGEPVEAAPECRPSRPALGACVAAALAAAGFGFWMVTSGKISRGEHGHGKKDGRIDGPRPRTLYGVARRLRGGAAGSAHRHRQAGAGHHPAVRVNGRCGKYRALRADAEDPGRAPAGGGAGRRAADRAHGNAYLRDRVSRRIGRHVRLRALRRSRGRRRSHMRDY